MQAVNIYWENVWKWDIWGGLVCLFDGIDIACDPYVTTWYWGFQRNDSVLLPNVPLQRDYEKQRLSLESVSSECLLILSHTFLIEVNEILCHTDWSKYRRTYWWRFPLATVITHFHCYGYWWIKRFLFVVTSIFYFPTHLSFSFLSSVVPYYSQ